MSPGLDVLVSKQAHLENLSTQAGKEEASDGESEIAIFGRAGAVS